MKKLIFAVVCLTALGLSACGRKSEASVEQINNAHAQAHEMLPQTHQDSVK